MHPDQFFQNDRTDKVCRTASRIATVVGAYKMILPLFKVVGSAVAHFCSTISAIDHTGKQTALARLCPAVTLLADLLHLVKDLLLNDRRVGVVENRLFFNGRLSLLLVPDGVGVGLEIDGASRVFPPFQNVNDRVGVPMVRIGGFRAGCLDALALLVGGGVKYLFRLQELCNLHRASPFHAQLEDTPHYHSRRFIHNPFRFVLLVFVIAKGNIGCQRYATLTLCFLHSPDFAAGVLSKKLVEPVLYSGNIAVCAVGVDGVKVVVDGNIPHIVLGEREVDIQPCQGRISTQSGQIFGDTDCHPSRFDLCKHGLEAGAVIVRAAVSVVHEKGRVRKAILFSVLEQDHFLILYGVRFILFAAVFIHILYGKATIECGDFISCP